MKSRWLSTFTLIGILLLVLGVVGLVMQHTGTGFVFDPGQPPSTTGPDRTPWYYLVIGALMVLNGLMTPIPVLAEAAEKAGAGKNGIGSASPATNGMTPPPSGSREAVATADTTTE